MIEPFDGFILVHISTPGEVCEQRDQRAYARKPAPAS